MPVQFRGLIPSPGARMSGNGQKRLLLVPCVSIHNDCRARRRAINTAKSIRFDCGRLPKKHFPIQAPMVCPMRKDGSLPRTRIVFRHLWERHKINFATNIPKLYIHLIIKC